MALTEAQSTDVRRFMGYGVAGGAGAAAYAEPVFSHAGHAGAYGGVSLSLRLANLQPSEEAILINTYLANLTTLETAIVGASANLDTDEAAVWKHNKRERQDREALFDSWRRRMCSFLGFKPGPDLGSPNNCSLVRG